MNRPSIDYLASGVNKTDNNKEAIIFCVETNKSIKEKIKRIEQKSFNKTDKKFEYFKFDKSEIESIVIDKEKERD